MVRDYLYIPLGGSRGGTWMKVRNTFIIFIVSGFWHGANWTFIIWGALNAIYFLPLLLSNNNRNNIDTVALGKQLPSFKEFFSMLITFGLTVFAWIFFRANNIEHAISYISGIFSDTLIKKPNIDDINKLLIVLFLILFFVFIEWLGRSSKYAIERINLKFSKTIRWGFYYFLILCIVYFQGEEQQFIYFQF